MKLPDFTDEMIEASIQNCNNFGAAVDMFHPDYGWILRDGKPTEAGLKFFQDKKKTIKCPIVEIAKHYRNNLMH